MFLLKYQEMSIKLQTCSHIFIFEVTKFENEKLFLCLILYHWSNQKIFFLENFNLRRSLLMIHLYHQTKTKDQ